MRSAIFFCVDILSSIFRVLSMEDDRELSIPRAFDLSIITRRLRMCSGFWLFSLSVELVVVVILSLKCSEFVSVQSLDSSEVRSSNSVGGANTEPRFFEDSRIVELVNDWEGYVTNADECVRGNKEEFLLFDWPSVEN